MTHASKRCRFCKERMIGGEDLVDVAARARVPAGREEGERDDDVAAAAAGPARRGEQALEIPFEVSILHILLPSRWFLLPPSHTRPPCPSSYPHQRDIPARPNTLTNPHTTKIKRNKYQQIR